MTIPVMAIMAATIWERFSAISDPGHDFYLSTYFLNELSVEERYATDPDTHEAILENDPGQQKDKGLVAAVEGRHVGGGQLLQSQQVQIVGQRPED